MTNQKITICLNMIVKNESHIIVNTLNKLCNKIKLDYWVICDTGSTDNTQEIITKFFLTKNIPGVLFNHEWVNFAHNRTLALQHAYNKTDLLLIFDADDEIVGEIKIPEEVTHDSYYLKFGDDGGFILKRILLINNRKKFAYKSVLHEFIYCTEANDNTTMLEGNYYVISGRKGSRSKDPNKYLNDALLLEKAHAEAVSTKDPLHLRYAFYCANSYKDCEQYENAIKWYKITLSQNNWNQEKYISCLYIYESYCKLNQSEIGMYYLVKSFLYDIQRVECLYPLLVHYSQLEMHKVAYNYYLNVKKSYETNYLNINLHNSDKLFVYSDKYNFYVPYYMIIISYYVNEFDTGINMFIIIFTKKYKLFEEWWINNLLNNLQFFITRVKLDEKDKFINLANEYINFLYKNGISLQKIESLKLYKKYGIDVSYIFPEQIINQNIKSENKVDTNLQSKRMNECMQKNILFYTGYSTENWNYTYMREYALGGSEKAVAYLSTYFPKEYNIYISGQVKEEQNDNIYYINIENLNKLIETIKFEVIIISRYVGFLELYPNIKYDKLYIWAHDTVLLPYGTNLTSEQIITKFENKINGCICLTNWQKELYIKTYPQIKNKISIINNGIFPELIIKTNTKQINKFIYTSRSERGLKILLNLWPNITKNLPDCTLIIASYSDFPSSNEDIKMQNIIKKHNNIVHLGKLTTNELYKQMSSSEYWMYPCIFNETSCITALEMLANEVICLYYPIAGLTDTINEYGIKITYGNEIEILLKLTDDRKTKLKLDGKKYAESCSWENKAKEWLNILL